MALTWFACNIPVFAPKGSTLQTLQSHKLNSMMRAGWNVAILHQIRLMMNQSISLYYALCASGGGDNNTHVCPFDPLWHQGPLHPYLHWRSRPGPGVYDHHPLHTGRRADCHGAGRGSYTNESQGRKYRRCEVTSWLGLTNWGLSKILALSRQHKMHFLEWKCWYFVSVVSKVCLKGLLKKLSFIQVT